MVIIIELIPTAFLGFKKFILFLVKKNFEVSIIF